MAKEKTPKNAAVGSTRLKNKNCTESTTSMNMKELEVEVAQAKLDAAKAKAIRAEKEWLRAQRLLQKKAITPSDTEQIECNHLVAQAELREAEARVKIAQLSPSL
jgi:multidrug resistance efflux pump